MRTMVELKFEFGGGTKKKRYNSPKEYSIHKGANQELKKNMFLIQTSSKFFLRENMVDFKFLFESSSQNSLSWE